MQEILQQLVSNGCPPLGMAIAVAKVIWEIVHDIQLSKEQLEVLSLCILQLLSTLDKQYKSGKITEGSTHVELEQLHDLLKEISAFITIQKKYGFFKLIILKDERKSAIEGYHRRIGTVVTSFQIAALVNIQDWQVRHDEARARDQAKLHAQLRRLEVNQVELENVLTNQGQQHPVAVMATLSRKIDNQDRMREGGKWRPERDPEEIRFYSHSLKYLQSMSGQQVDLKPWTVTSLEVEFGMLVGSGGFGKVYRGKWNQMDVALKVMKNPENLTPQASVIKREVDTWSQIRHPHILQFLGANILDDEPFIVMPFIKHGNAKSYLHEHPNCDRLKLIHEISLGLTYLHAHSIIHGDLKAVNVLIDEGPKALLCDFGLARIRSDLNSRTTGASKGVIGSLNWMAPELLNGRSLRKPCDIYAFGMTMYEIYTLETPFGFLSYDRLLTLVCEKSARPQRPEDDEAPQLTDSVWDVAEQCWAPDPADRLSAAAVCEKLSALLSNSPYISPNHDMDGNTLISPTLPSPVIPFTSSHSPSRQPIALSSSPSGQSATLVSAFSYQPPSPSIPFDTRRSKAMSLYSIPERVGTTPIDFSENDAAAALFKRPRPKFRHIIQRGSTFEPAKGRYHLYLSYACPRSTQVLIALKLKQLEQIITFTILSPRMDTEGWVFATVDDFSGAERDPHKGAHRLKDIYLDTDPDYSDHFTLPVLWDRKKRTIVNNSPTDIVRMFGTVFNEFLSSKLKAVDFYRSDMAEWIGRLHLWFDSISEAIYRAGYARVQEDLVAATTEVFKALEKLEEIFGTHKTLLSRSSGDPTEVDLALWALLIRFDPVYFGLFKCNKKSIREGFPFIHKWMRRLYWTSKAFQDSTNFDHIKAHYFWSHPSINPTQTIPVGPEPNVLPLDDKHLDKPIDIKDKLKKVLL